MISPHALGRVVALITGQRVATRFLPNIVVGHRVIGTDVSVHQRNSRPSTAGGWGRKHNSDLWEIHV